MGGMTSGSSVTNSTQGRSFGSLRRTQNTVGVTISTPTAIVNSAMTIENRKVVWNCGSDSTLR